MDANVKFIQKKSLNAVLILPLDILYLRSLELKDFSVSLVCFSSEIIEVSMISYSIRIPHVFWTISNKHLPSYAGA